MSDRTRDGLFAAGSSSRGAKRVVRPRVESLEQKALLATLSPIANVAAPAALGYQVPLNGGASGDQTYSVASSNPAIQATIAKGKFLTINVTHTSSGANDPAFTGSMTFQLFEDLTPITAQKIEQLVTQGFYTSPTTGTPTLPNKNFHRIASGFPDANGFIVQGGSQSGNGQGSLSAPGFPFADEYNQQLIYDGSGQLAMANAGDDTNDSQFFITTGQPRFLDFTKTIFGQLVAGQDILTDMTKVPRDSNDAPLSPILMNSTTLSDTNPNGVVHINLTGASVGQTGTVTVTARDGSGGTVQRSFTVTAVANNDANGQPITEKPFLNPVQNQVVGLNQTAVYQIQGVATTPNDPLTYAVGGSISTGANPTFQPIPTTQGTATVDGNGIVTVTPAKGFTGVINLIVGVRDQVNRQGSGTTIDNAKNFDTQKMTLTVNNGAIVNLKPIAIPGFVAASPGTNTQVQLLATTANPGTSQTLTYTILTPPSHGTITNFNASTGTFTYTPNDAFQGNDTLTFSVTDVGAPTPNLTSNPAVETFVVGGTDTGAVRLIDRVLVITPLPKANLADTARNIINVTDVGGILQVTVNGLIDKNEPSDTSVDRIVVYGSKNADTITIDPSVILPTTLDGGHGGNNVISAGTGPAMEFGWFQRFNTLKGGASNDTIYGKAGAVRFVRSPGKDLYYAGNANLGHRQHAAIFPGKIFSTKPHPPSGTFYRFIGKHLTAIKTV